MVPYFLTVSAGGEGITPMLDYIVDFCCKELRLVIELDGRYHDFKVEYDLRRQKRIESYGVQVIWFEEMIVLEDIDQVLTEIRYWEKFVFGN